ncbi:MAG TPA: 2-amino-4-hydroxy-6-hydroxymethyldihydropteridine diphosphokinase [Rhizomicrobium sp.]|nr:2-amino-4-hydroxy-6-hydroxymethyldihydropteridine diphosphokinase [Rhizomicrobium sp.]
MIVIALGANLNSHAGTPRDTLRAALATLAERCVRILTVSPFYRTRAWPDPRDPDFVNAVAIVSSDLSPAGLMATLQQTETLYGRVRSEKNAPRTLDLDIVDYDGRIEAGPPILPHPRLSERAFVLVPLADAAPGWRHPVTGKSVEELIAALPDGTAGTERLDT